MNNKLNNKKNLLWMIGLVVVAFILCMMFFSDQREEKTVQVMENGDVETQHLTVDNDMPDMEVSQKAGSLEGQLPLQTDNRSRRGSHRRNAGKRIWIHSHIPQSWLYASFL